MDEPSRGPITSHRAWRINFGEREQQRQIHGFSRLPVVSRKSNSEVSGKDHHDEESEDSTLDANEILLQLNEDPCTSASGESSIEAGKMSSNAVRPRLEESDAKRQIELIFRTPACWRSETDQAHLLYLLQRFPSLAAQNFDWDYNLFWQHGSEWSSPLCFLLASGANLETIESVYYLHPESIWKPQGVHRDLPLHFACRYGASEDVLLFLIHKFPHAAMVSNSTGMLPIHCALGKKDVFPYGRFTHASLETIKILVELYPQGLMREEQESFYKPLQIAFAHKYSFEAIDYIMSKMPRKMEGFDLRAGCYHSKRFTVEFNIAESVLVSKLLPRLQRFHCQPTEWKIGGLVQLLMHMQHNTSVRKFKVMNLPSKFLLDGLVVNAIAGLLRCNNTLESLGLSLRSEGENTDTSIFFQHLNVSLQRNRGLQCLELDNFSVTYRGLNQFLSSDHAPPFLRMTNFSLQECASEGTQWNQPNTTSKVEKIILSSCKVLGPPEDGTCPRFLSLLQGIAALPQLKDFTLDTLPQRSLDITEPLISLLQSESLESLRIRGSIAQIKPVCEALQSNKSLSRIDFPALLKTKGNKGLLARTLENHNARIEYVQLPSIMMNSTKEEKDVKKIRYVTKLNHFGRGHLRESNTTTKAFVVKLLLEFESQSQDLQADEKLSIQFGLLRESPSLWCTTAPNERNDCNHRRRKRQRIA